MPSSRQARMTRKAISPRFAIKTFSNMILRQAPRLPALAVLGQAERPPYKCASSHAIQYLAKLHRFAVLRHDLCDHPTGLSLDFVHHFHCFDNTDDRFFVHFLADL